MPLKSLPEGAIVAICGAFAGFCGSLSYLLKVEEGKPFSWREFALHTTISAVFGLIAYEILSYEAFRHRLLARSAAWLAGAVLG